MATVYSCVYPSGYTLTSAESTRYSTRKYTSMSAANAADFGAVAGDDVVCEILPGGDGSAAGQNDWGTGTYGAGADTTAITLTATAFASLTITALSGAEALKTGWDTGRYRLIASSGDTLAVPYGGTQDLTFAGPQLGTSSTGYGSDVLTLVTAPSGKAITIDGCRIEKTSASGNANQGIAQSNLVAGTTIDISNTIVRGFSATSSRGIYLPDTDSTTNIYNSVVESCNTGVYGGTSVTVKNCAVFNNTDDFVGTFAAIDYCASDDGDGTNSVSPSGGSWANEFSGPANGDYTLLNTGALYGAGVGPDTDATVPTTDIDGDTRSGTTCDIGADEYAAGGGGTLALSGTLAAVASLAGGLDVSADLAGGVTGAAALTGDVAQAAALAGTVAGASTLAGALDHSATLAGGLVATTALTGATDQAATLAGPVHVVVTLTGDVTASTPGSLAGAIAITSTLTGDAAMAADLAGDLAAAGVLTGSLDLAATLAGGVVGVTVLGGDAASAQTLDAALDAVASLAGDLSITYGTELAGTISAVVTLTGDLSTTEITVYYTDPTLRSVTVTRDLRSVTTARTLHQH